MFLSGPNVKIKFFQTNLNSFLCVAFVLCLVGHVFVFVFVLCVARSLCVDDTDEGSVSSGRRASIASDRKSSREYRQTITTHYHTFINNFLKIF